MSVRISRQMPLLKIVFQYRKAKMRTGLNISVKIPPLGHRSKKISIRSAFQSATKLLLNIR